MSQATTNRRREPSLLEPRRRIDQAPWAVIQ